MLNETQLEDYFQRNNIIHAARHLIREIRSSQPSRRVKSGIANVACRYASRKMGMVIQAESHKNELAAVVDWEHDPGTHEFYDQPPRIRLEYRNTKGRKVAYPATADFFLLQDGFTGWVECKTEEWLQAKAKEKSELFIPDGKGGWRCPPGERYAESFGLGFKVRSSAETNWNRHSNLEFLSDYLDARCPEPSAKTIEQVRNVFAQNAWVKLKDLVDALPSESDTVYKMVADGMLYVDLEKFRLAEPERTLVFRDRLSADAHRIHVASTQVPAIGDIRPVKVARGQTLVWDGRPWRILNVGDEDVYMEDEEKAISSLRRPVLEQMVRDGVIKGLPTDVQSDRHKAEEMVRRASPQDYEHALYRYRCIFPDRADGVLAQASDRALRKWRALYRKSAELFGSGFLGLLPKIHLRGNRQRKLDDAVIAIMDEAIDELYAKPGEKTLVTCWGQVRNACKDRGLLPPSEIAFRAQVKRRRENDLKEAREGRKAAYPQQEFFWRLERTTPRHGERPYEIAHIDHTELDLQFVGSRKGEKLGKAWLTVMIDAHTRMILAWVILFEEPSYRSCMMVIRECVRRHGRVPKYIVVDQGSEFEGIYFEVLLARLESHKKTRPASRPRFGSIIERFFGMSNDAFVHNLKGNNQALQKPRQLVKEHDPRELAVWTLPEFREAFEGFIDRVYAEMEHPALGMSPKEAMAVGLVQSGMRAHSVIPYGRDFVIMCLPSTRKGTAKVDTGRGVKIGYIYYWTPEFRDPRQARQDVPVRYDPFDVSVAYVWLKDHWVLCRSERAEDFEGWSEKEIQDATRELRARKRHTGERRAINAEIIARYLKEMAGTEKHLAMRKKQLEQKGTPAFHEGRPPLVGDDAPFIPDNHWVDSLSVRIMGEFLQ